MARKFLIFLILIAIAILTAGVYGVIHDQVTYTVSPEYYAKFKFHQFGLSDSPLPDRIKASVVGFLASWWMGIPIGILVGSIGFIHRDYRRMFRVTLWSFLLVIGYTLAVELAGLGYGYHRTATINLSDYRYWFIPSVVVDLRRYLCVGYMHNSSYLGGAASIIVAWVFHVVVRIRSANRLERDVDSAPAAPSKTETGARRFELWCMVFATPILAIGSYLTSYFIIVDLHHPAQFPKIWASTDPNAISFVEINREWTAYPGYHGLPCWLFAPIH